MNFKPHVYLEDFSGDQLRDLYNQVTGKNIKKFETRAKGIKRVQQAIAEKYDGLIPSNNQPMVMGVAFDHDAMVFEADHIDSDEPTAADEVIGDASPSEAPEDVMARETIASDEADTTEEPTVRNSALDAQTYELLAAPTFREGTLRQQAWQAIADGQKHAEARHMDKRFAGIISWFVRAGYVKRVTSES